MAPSWTPNQYRWNFLAAPTAAEAIAGKKYSPLIATILAHRGVTSVAQADAFLNPSLNDLHDPATLHGCEQAASILADAIRAEKKIVIYGDYDVDGITSVSILLSCITLLGGTASHYIPHRLDEGYGVNPEALEELIGAGAELIVTVDCGVTAVETLAEFSGRGCEFIITDHHTPSSSLPNVAAVVHPALGDAAANRDLCGAGVAFKLAWQTARAMCGNTRVDDDMKRFLLEATTLAALGTIADVVPLTGENRIIAAFGLRGIANCKLPGVSALVRLASLDGKPITARDVAFRIAPRLNAAGRMGHAGEAVELLSTADGARANELATFLDQQNNLRRDVEKTITAQALEMVESRGLNHPDNRTIVLASSDWHGGVIGIVASRMVDRFHRPSVLIGINDEGFGQGSGRSVRGFNLVNAIRACEGHLLSCGGHAMAAGLRMKQANFDAFAAAFEAYARENSNEEQLAPPLDIDAETTFAALDQSTVRTIEQLQPFGCQNTHPVVAVRNCRIAAPAKRMGKNGSHVSMLLDHEGTSLRVIGFGMGDLADALLDHTHIDIAGEPTLNTFNGRTNVELRLQDVQYCAE